MRDMGIAFGTDNPTGLSAAFEPCMLTALTAIAAAGDEDGMDRDLRAILLDQLNAGVERLADLYPTAILYQARRLVTAWLDERLASDDWPGREAWIAHPLQSDWGEGRHGGQWFFQAIEGLKPVKPGHADLARLALRLLALGFSGRESAESVLALRRNVADRFGVVDAPEVFPPLVPSADKRPIARIRLAWWLGLGVLAVALAIAVVVANLCLENELQRSIPQGHGYSSLFEMLGKRFL